MDLRGFQVQIRKEAEREPTITTLADVDSSEILRGVAVRMPPSYAGQRHYPGFFWSATTHRTHVYESLLELSCLWLADFNPHTTALITQPLHIVGPDDERTRRHVPDLLLAHDDGATTLVDVKSKQRLDKPEVKEQFSWTARWCMAKGWRYEVFSGAHAVTLRNIKYLSVGRRPELLPSGALEEVRAARPAGLTLRAIGAAPQLASMPHSTVRLATFCLLWSGEWQTDLQRPLTSNSLIQCVEPQ